MSKKIKIKLLPDGRIEAITQDIKGTVCLDYLPLLEKLVEARVVDSQFTTEYYEKVNQVSGLHQPQILDEDENLQEL